MRHTIKTATITVMLCLVLMLLAGVAQTPSYRFQQAVDLLESKGDVPGALKLFEELAKSPDRSVAARSLLYVGSCHEKLGKDGAQKAYERIAREFADQAEAATEARARLAALGQSARIARGEKTGPVITELKLDAGGAQHYALSPDGKRLVYTNSAHRNLVIRDLATGSERQITKDGPAGHPWWPIWSHDGKQIAFQRMVDSLTYEVRIVSLDTGQERGTGVSAYPLDWSADGRYILYIEGGLHRVSPSVGLFPVAGGPVKTLNPDPPGWYHRLSPDGRYLSYSASRNGASEVFVMPLEGGETVNITNDPASDYDPIWTPGGKTLLFQSNRRLGTTDLWGVPVADGKPAGPPFLVREDTANVELFTLSNNGRLLLSRTEPNSHIYVTSVDPTTGRPSGRAVKLTKDSSPHRQPAVSPDGKRIAYLSGKTLWVMNTDGTNEREIARVEPLIGPFVWAADNQHIYIAEKRHETGKGIYVYSILTGEVKPILVDQKIMGHLSISPDGKHLAFGCGQICVVDTNGKNLRQIISETADMAWYPAWSPGGREIAFYKRAAGRTSLQIVSLADGSQRALLDNPTAEGRFWEPAWSPDGRWIAWCTETTDSRTEIRIAATSGGGKYEPFLVDLGTSVKPSEITSPRWFPDGRKMAFIAGNTVHQVLLMENFLPAPKAAGKQ